MTDHTRADSYGVLLKYWRKRAGIAQMDLSQECDTSARHLSCVETAYPMDEASEETLHEIAS